MLIYDIEIINAIPSSREPRVEGITYCGGWYDHANMGISVIGAYDYQEDRYRVFCEDNQEEFAHLVSTRGVFVGFNNIRFDNVVIKEAWGIDIPEIACYDILQKVWKGAGFGPEFDRRTHAGYGLDACCRANFGTKKSGHGAIAPIAWQQGRIAEVIDYCLNDVKLTKQLLDKVIRDGYIVDPKDARCVLYMDSVPITGVLSTASVSGGNHNEAKQDDLPF